MIAVAVVQGQCKACAGYAEKPAIRLASAGKKRIITQFWL
jgi:hypothetical protein